ncbi:MAG: glycosyltransferase [Pseudomonadota bacterium]
MTLTTVSVVVVSHGRPEDLLKCLTALRQQTHANFEIVVVADASSLSAVDLQGVAATQVFDVANISQARNIGIALSAGELIAFIDDDAVAEPRWLEHLSGAFLDQKVGAAGGFVLGRNGISLQWAGQSIDATGTDHTLAIEADKTAVPQVAPGFAVRTQGTNMMFRREVLRRLGGFDPAFAFYLEDSDLNMRIAADEIQTAIAPLAVVHHAFAPNANRRADRGPADLHEIGASSAVFHCKYLRERDWAPAREAMFNAQRRRLLGFMVDGRSEPRRVEQCLDGLLRGYDEGMLRQSGNFPELSERNTEFQPFSSDRHDPAEDCVLHGHWRERHRLRRQAAELTTSGHRVSLFLLHQTSFFHRMRYRMPGYWEQSGGVYGKSDRADPLWAYWRTADRLRREVERIGAVRFPSEHFG